MINLPAYNASLCGLQEGETARFVAVLFAVFLVTAPVSTVVVQETTAKPPAAAAAGSGPGGQVVRVVEDSVGSADDATASAKFEQTQSSLEAIEESSSITVLDGRGLSGIENLRKSDFAVSSTEPDDIVTIVAKGQDDSGSVTRELGPVREFDRTPEELRALWVSLQQVR